MQESIVCNGNAVRDGGHDSKDVHHIINQNESMKNGIKSFLF